MAIVIACGIRRSPIQRPGNSSRLSVSSFVSSFQGVGVKVKLMQSSSPPSESPVVLTLAVVKELAERIGKEHEC